MADRQILGSFELVTFPSFNLHDIVAKVDTGAYSGAIHCSDITVTNDAQDQPVLCCRFSADGPEFKTTSFKKRIVRSSNGRHEGRYLVFTKVIVRGQSYDIEVGLTDRSVMRRQVLLGRKFIRQNNMLVDVSLHTEYDEEGEKL